MNCQEFFHKRIVCTWEQNLVGRNVCLEIKKIVEISTVKKIAQEDICTLQ